ncbi:MAG: CotH kinase family protein [Sedimentisphaerales bacterium]|nr:CotH kinase family protein [Sedimentisphaerales bacterium]
MKACRDATASTKVMILSLMALGTAVAAGQTSESPLAISEFMAVNETVMPTRIQGRTVYPDWIELHNRGTTTQNLAGWYLTDDPNVPAKWALPPLPVPAGAYLVVCASGIQEEDHPENWPYRDDQGRYHANFSLAAEGEYLALVGPDLKVAHAYGSPGAGDAEPGFPPQQTDISYGLYAGTPQYFTDPTPGRANAPGYAAISDPPIFSHEGGAFTGFILLELSSPNPAGEVRYTLDGDPPDLTSRVYTSPLPILSTREVIARAYEPGKAPSAAVSQTYLALSDDVIGFSSNLPIVIVDTSRQSIGSSFAKVYTVFIDAGDDGRAHITDPADFYGRAGLKRRGSSTQGVAKPSYALELRDEYGRDCDASLLGLPADSDWILYAPFNYDRALINNAFVFDLSNQIGRYAVRSRFVEMYLNANDGTISAGDYVGLYILMEKIKRGEDRVDIEKLEPWDSTEPRISGGYMLKIDRPDPGDSGFRTARGNPTFGDGTLCYVDPKESEITSVQSAWIRGYLNDFEDALYGPAFAHPVTGYAHYIDVNSFIDHNLLNMLTMNVDALRLSTFLYKTRAGKLEMGPLWDFDRALDSTDGRDNNAQSWHGTGDGTDYHNYVWWNRLFEDVDFWQKYIDRWYELRRGSFSTENLNATIDILAAEIWEAQARNYQRWPGQGPRFGGFQGEIEHLKQWLETRCTWVDAQFVAPPVISPDGGHLETGGLVSLTNPHGAGLLYYTLDGSDPRPPQAAPTTVDTVTLVEAGAAKRVLVPDGPVDNAWRGGATFNDSTWTGGTGGVGYESSRGYEAFFDIDVQSLMYGRQTSCFIRIPFVVTEDPGTIDVMALRMRYDDGFVAYLNGVEIQRALFTGTPAWNSRADGNHDDTDALSFEQFDVSAHAGLLRKGLNLLAIHALNSSSTSSDFLIDAELIAGQASSPTAGGMSDAVHTYTGPISLGASTQIKARVLVANNPYSPWSGLAEATFAVGPVAESLRISEIMYHPIELGGPDDPNCEYIELTNVGAETINLNLVRFTDGVDFAFPSVDLAPGGYLVVVRDLDAFQARYGSDVPVAGQYTGSLNNAGERIELRDAAGRAIHDFSFQDDWYDLTDGLGYSLTIRDSGATDPSLYADKNAWQCSTGAGGSPGYADALTPTGGN